MILVDFENNNVPWSKLAPLLSHKKFIFLGEPDHWVQEKYLYRTAFLDYFLEQGLSHLGLEMGFSDGQRYHNFLKSGKTEDINRLALYGAQVPQQGADGFDGILVDKSELITTREKNENPFVLAEKAHAHTLYKMLKKKDRQLQFFGFDVDVVAGGAYQDMSEMLDNALHIQHITRIQRLELNAAIAELEDFCQTLKYTQDFDSEDQRLLGMHGDVLLESLRFAAVAFCNPSEAALLSAYRQREQTMFKIFDYYCEGAASDSLFVLMGHNMHLLKNHQAMFFGAYDDKLPLWPTLGDYIYHKYPTQTLAIWMLFHEGEHSAPSVFESKIAPKDDVIEAIFAEFGTSFLLPVDRSTPVLNQFNRFVCNNGTYASGVLSEAADLIYFKKVVSKI